MKALRLAAALLASAPAIAAETAVSKVDTIVCRERIDLLMLRDNPVDPIATQDRTRRYWRDGKCFVVRKGQAVTIDQEVTNRNNVQHDIVVCVQIPGQPQCLWTPRENLADDQGRWNRDGQTKEQAGLIPAPEGLKLSTEEETGDGASDLPQKAFGCLAKQDYERMHRISSSGDKRALGKFMLEMVGPRCGFIDKGHKIFIEETMDSPKGLCIRPRGETSCLWVLPSVFE